MLEVKKLTKSYHGKEILNNVSFEVKRGEIAIFLGGSGTGKSTLLRILNKLESANSGEIYLDGEEIPLSRLNRKHLIGMVFQHFNLFENLTVEENITLPLIKALKKSPEEAHTIATTLLEKYSLVEHSKKSVAKLSGGQKQRLAIARTLSLQPEIVCLDEPTSALDPLLTNQVADTIKEIASQGRIVLLTTHDIALIEKLPCKIFLMKDQTICETATSEQFHRSPEQYPHLTAFVTGA